jgi:hypothetical protein
MAESFIKLFRCSNSNFTRFLFKQWAACDRELASLRLQLQQSKDENKRLKAKIVDINAVSGASVGEQVCEAVQYMVGSSKAVSCLLEMS